MSLKLILSINAGSSSVKVSIFTYTSPTTKPKQIADIQISGLTSPPATLKYSRNGSQQIANKEILSVRSAQDAWAYILNTLINDHDFTALQHPDDIEFACHRVVHGGDYERPTRIDQDTFHHLEALSDLAPLHNAGALEIVKAVHDKCPKTTNIAFFDSSFHATIPAPAKTYAINQDIARKNGLRKYGFHGLSYSYINRVCASHLSKPASEMNLIALHLGSGASACCIRNGQSVDTSMGLTPLAGLPGATRSGDVDPSLIFHFTHEAGKLSPGSTKDMHITQAEQVLNKESGWKALTGTTDFGTISSKAGEGDEMCKLAFDIFVDRIVGYVGSYYVKLDGDVDALVFAGGLGEKGSALREAVVKKVGCLGFEIDRSKNEKPGDEVVVDVGKEGARHRVLVCQTDEQAEMAGQCAKESDNLRRP
ncbi:hypothetical protein LTR37_009796 [Vermiconidia calcicola]|uniref:Uncharacterized protein n=1 Tax=Vermiconidia calcicola TaxID=1690605 RepID=A0ACC3N8C6_9PEZI|nr:hypothetical protein LTR37_009796 [Vermiconidia calcicola]